MLDRKVAELLNTQVNQEFYSAYLYLDFANYYEEQGLSGFSNWYRVQAQEERDHAMLFIQYLQNNGEHVSLEAVAKPDQTFSDNTAPLKAGLAHERYVTGLIHTIYDAAYSARDFRTMQSVSYTHLDVYKRQFPPRARAFPDAPSPPPEVVDRAAPAPELEPGRERPLEICLLYTSRCV